MSKFPVYSPCRMGDRLPRQRRPERYGSRIKRMSAFGRRPGTAGRPAFGVAKPMQTGPGVPGGAQFPAIDPAPAEAPPPIPSNLTPEEEAMERLNQRSTADMAEPEKAQGFEASVHKIKEQVLPRLLERVDPEAAATQIGRAHV